jgi:Ni,Fe-hydrogenase III large subunit
VRTIPPAATSGWPATDHTPPATPAASGVGIAEGWRGTIVHRIEINPQQQLTRNKIVDPSFLNWPALPSRWPARSSPTSRWPTKASISPTPGTTSRHVNLLGRSGTEINIFSRPRRGRYFAHNG